MRASKVWETNSESQVLCSILDGSVTKENMSDFIKMIKKTSRLSDEDAARIAAIKVHEATPKSRMYYKINAQRELGGGKKVDPTSNMPARLKVSRVTI